MMETEAKEKRKRGLRERIESRREEGERRGGKEGKVPRLDTCRL